jgi:hypothetical protein
VPMFSPLSFDKAAFLIGTILAILLVVLDKAGKLTNKPALMFMLLVCAVLTLPLALHNGLVQSGSRAWKWWKACVSVAVVLCAYGALMIWIADAKGESKEPPPPPERASAESKQAKPTKSVTRHAGTPRNVIIQTATPYGNLQQRAMNLAQAIFDDLYVWGWDDNPLGQLHPSPGKTQMKKRPRSGPEVAEWDHNRVSGFLMRYGSQVIELRDEFAQLHIRDAELDSVLGRLEPKPEPGMTAIWAGRNSDRIMVMDIKTITTSLTNLARQAGQANTGH